MTITVFLADDHSIVREGLANLLDSNPMIKVIGSANDGREAVRQVILLKPDVVILDISMPDMNGIEGARQIRERTPLVRIIMLTMHATSEHIFQALDAGVNGYILKESAAQVIIRAVQTVVTGKRFLCPIVSDIVTEQLGTRVPLNPMETLSKREREILQLVVEGGSSAEIARKLNLSSKTVDTYRSRLMQKLQIKDVGGLIKFALKHGLISMV